MKKLNKKQYGFLTLMSFMGLISCGISFSKGNTMMLPLVILNALGTICGVLGLLEDDKKDSEEETKEG